MGRIGRVPHRRSIGIRAVRPMRVEMVSVWIKVRPAWETKNYPRLHTMMRSIGRPMVVMVDMRGTIMMPVMPMVAPVTGVCDGRDAEV
jgi:hypothetical protein